MTQLRYIGSHKPKGMIIDVEEKRVEGAINSGEFVRIDDMLVERKKPVETKKKKLRQDE